MSERPATEPFEQLREHRLPDGRVLAYAAWGSSGPVIIHHHGTGSSRLEAAALARAAAGASIRVLGVDRPGCGGSTPDPHRDFHSVQADVEHLADALGIDRFCVSGLSGGAAFACAAALSPRTLKAYPLNMSVDFSAAAARRTPLMLRFLVWLMVRPATVANAARKAAADPLGRLSRSMPHIDRMVLTNEVPDIWAATVREGSRLGVAGVERDAALLRRPWGIDWDRLRAPIEIRQGRQDPFVSFPRALAAQQPGVSLIEFDGGHHAALGRAVLETVVEDVVTAAAR